MRRKKVVSPEKQRKSSPKKKSYCAPPAVKVPKTPFIGNQDQAPSYLRFNPYIMRGYRINYNSWFTSTTTLFKAHNETTNVLSHLAGAIIYIYMIYYIIFNLQPPSLTDGGVIQRWTTPGLDTGRLNAMLCPADKNHSFTND